jgi:hypothetical protein
MARVRPPIILVSDSGEELPSEHRIISPIIRILAPAICSGDSESFCSDSSEVLDPASDREEETQVAESQSLRSLRSIPTQQTDPGVSPRSASSSYSSFVASSIPRPPLARRFAKSQASQDSSDDEYEEEEDVMNTSDRNFIASSQSQIRDSPTMYRLLDRSPKWKVSLPSAQSDDSANFNLSSDSWS